ncbi:MAG: acryloyl-CoA reductase [Lysobacteraceae bacterium]
MSIPANFRAFRIHGKTCDGWRAGIEETSLDALSEGEVVIRTAWSSVNYKDALAGTGRGAILKTFPLIGGIDVAGTVASSQVPHIKEGDEVIVTGCGLSETRDGGYSEYVRVPAKAVIPLPKTLSMREAMILGTAGYTAALSLLRMERLGQRPEHGPIVVTGASGGVGTIAIDLLTCAGYEVHAITGKFEEQLDFLTKLGAKQVISRKNLHFGQRPLEKAIWAGALDGVGGETLEGLTRCIQPGGNIASYGMAGGTELHTTVMPFILRGISLIGITASGSGREDREAVWKLLGGAWKPIHLSAICQQEIGLEALPEAFATLAGGKARGRIAVRIG